MESAVVDQFGHGGVPPWLVLFFIDHNTHRVHIAGTTPNPTGPWITQQARKVGLRWLRKWSIRARGRKRTAGHRPLSASTWIAVHKAAGKTSLRNNPPVSAAWASTTVPLAVQRGQHNTLTPTI
ncbi:MULTISPECIES: hypothetical protein [Streptomyces violaceusniger group]|uniref:hypothetical protein n=1 Tax=Streptomyces violaceusniger group TaxID=2839105 RepID=UPI000A39537C|nr:MULTISPECIES: hypothetical protein [Streptomyces violaceusniger group]